MGPPDMQPVVLRELTRVTTKLLVSLRGCSEQGRFLMI